MNLGWAEVPEPGNMADFDKDTELEEGGPEPASSSVLSTDDSDYWDLDDWGED